MRGFRSFVSTIVLSLPLAASAQFGPGAEYPQFRALGGLPGTGVAVGDNRKPGFRGALTYNTPVAFSLGHLKGALAASSVSNDRSLKWFDTDGRETDRGNGTGAVLLGYELGRYNFTGSLMFLSSIGDNVFNLHFEVPKRVNLDIYEEKFVTFGLGIQDIVGDGGFRPENDPKGDGNSRSVYGVATAKFMEDAYVSAGIGSGRFKRGFLSASYGFKRWVKAFAEHDGFGLTYGLAVGDGPAVGQIGFTDGDKAFFTLGVGF